MTHDEIIAVIQAHKEGKTVQFTEIECDNWVNWISDRPPNDFLGYKWRVKPEKIVRYFNMYPDLGYENNFSSRVEADRRAGDTRTACIRIEYEEGQFDD